MRRALLPVVLLGALASGCADAESSPRPAPTPPPAGVAGGPGSLPEAAPPLAAPSVQPSDYDLRALGVMSLLRGLCATCFPTLEGKPPEHPYDLEPLSRLIAEREILPGNASGSPLWQRLSQGLLPAGAPRSLTRGELALLGELIDQLPAEPAPPCEPLPFLSSDEVLATLVEDLQGAESPTTTRYVSLTYASNAGACGAELERHRSALFKAVNSVSTRPAIAVPAAIDPMGLLYRIDLRDYGWERPLDLEDDGELDFADGWLAITATAGVYARELAGPEADVLKLAAQTPVPLLPAHVLVWTTATGDLYYALTGARQNAHDTRAALGVDVAGAVASNSARRAGFSGFGFNEDAMVLRLEQAGPGARAYWLLLPSAGDGATIFDDPLELPWEGGLSIAQLPNGMLAFGVEETNGYRLNAMPICIGPCGLESLGSIAACHACHESGLLPVADMIRSYADENSSLFDGQTLGDVRLQYPGGEAILELMAADSQVTIEAARQAGITRGGPEPLAYVYTQYELGSLSIDAAAAELGVTPLSLREQLGTLSPEWQGMAEPNGVIDRQIFVNHYAQAVCALHAVARNRPVGCP